MIMNWLSGIYPAKKVTRIGLGMMSNWPVGTFIVANVIMAGHMFVARPGIGYRRTA